MTAEEVFKVVPVLSPATTEEIEDAVAARFNGRKELDDAGRRALRGRLRRLRRAGRVQQTADGWRRVPRP